MMISVRVNLKIIVYMNLVPNFFFFFLGRKAKTELVAQSCPTLCNSMDGSLSGSSVQRPWFDLCVGKIPWRREWQSTLVSLPRESHGQRSLVGYSPWSRKESDMTQQLTLSKLDLGFLTDYLPVCLKCCYNFQFLQII